ncbi:MAG: NAD kinase [Bacteroidia bacterium]|nr:NAD kinase [Bacteroidia bacterium]
MLIAIYGKSLNNYNASPIQRLITKLESAGAELCLHQDFYNIIKEKIKFSTIISCFKDDKVLQRKPSFFCSIGGDGTMLKTITLVGNSNIPIIGINTGRLGFLSGISIEDIETAIDLIFVGKYELDKRSLVRLEAAQNPFGKFNFGLNEVTVHKNDNTTMMTIHTYVNGEFLNSYWADGLIISTPTGSTAYSLSCGGPLVMPDSSNFIITPISPHNLNVRPIIISDKDIVTLRVEGRNDNFLVTLDSRQEIFDANEELTIMRENFMINLVRIKGNDFMNTLRLKLMWGIDKRN